MIVLGIESSCDDTSAAVVIDGVTIKSNVISGQEDIHNCFGGVVPELASRSHLSAIYPVVDTALKKAGIKLSDVDLIAATQGPGLTGSLLIGFSYAKALSLAQDIAFVGVDHMAGHISASLLEDKTPAFPFIALIASGGTTSIYLVKSHTEFTLLGRTRDDAAGEAFDKVAKVLGLPYPGGPHVSSLATQGDPKSIKFPRAWLETNSLDFSFSGLKTSVLNYFHKIRKNRQTLEPSEMSDICASFQQAVIDVLISKTILAAKEHNISTIVLGGGVSSNKELRQQFQQQCEKQRLQFYVPRPILCTDNGAMIAVAGYHKYKLHGATPLGDDVYSRSPLG